MYCPQASFTVRFGPDELAQVLATNGGLDYVSASEDADAIVDSYLAAIPGRAFLLPLTAPPARIVGVAADLTRYELCSNRASEEIRNRRDQAIEYLKDLAAGRAMLLLLAAEIIAVNETLAGRVAFRTNGRIFTDCTLAAYVGTGNCDDPLGGLRGCD